MILMLSRSPQKLSSALRDVFDSAIVPGEQRYVERRPSPCSSWVVM